MTEPKRGLGAPRCSVSVLGVGLMGAAVARTLGARGHDVTVWNRTPARARPLLDEGLRVAAGAVEAVEAGEVCILLLTDAAAARPLLEEAGPRLAGKTVLNLMTGSEQDALSTARFVTDAGGQYVDGAILAYPSQIGGVDTTVLYCGAEAAWAEYRWLFEQLGGQSRWLGPNAGAAAVLDTAATGAFFQTSLAAFVEAARYAEARGLDIETLSDVIIAQLDGFKRTLAGASHAIATREWEAREATLDIYAAATRSWRDEMRRAGVATPLITASLESMTRAQSAGLGARSFYAQILTSDGDRH